MQDVATSQGHVMRSFWDQGDEVQKQVAEVAKALDQRSDELAVRTCPRSPVVGGRRR